MTNQVTEPIDLDHVDSVHAVVHVHLGHKGPLLFDSAVRRTTMAVDREVLHRMEYYTFRQLFRQAMTR